MCPNGNHLKRSYRKPSDKISATFKDYILRRCTGTSWPRRGFQKCGVPSQVRIQLFGPVCRPCQLKDGPPG